MNKKKVLSLVLVGALATSVLVGCAKDKENTSNTNEQTQTQQTEQETEKVSATEVSFTVVEELDEETQKTVDEKAKEKGFVVLSQEEESAVVMISSGEKPSGGYAIEVKTAEEKDGVVTITVKETAPEEDAIVTDAITQPYTVVKLETKATAFNVLNAEGEEWANLDKVQEEEKEVIEAEGTYNGAIDNNSIEIQLDGEDEPMAFRTEALENFEAPEDNAKVKITYYTNEHGQNMLENIETIVEK